LNVINCRRSSLSRCPNAYALIQTRRDNIEVAVVIDVAEA
jgi:hypothetical protein